MCDYSTLPFIHWYWKTYSWPPFNIADACIVVGVIALLLFGGDVLGQKKGPKKNKAKKKEKKVRA